MAAVARSGNHSHVEIRQTILSRDPLGPWVYIEAIGHGMGCQTKLMEGVT